MAANSVCSWTNDIESLEALASYSPLFDGEKSVLRPDNSHFINFNDENVG